VVVIVVVGGVVTGPDPADDELPRRNKPNQSKPFVEVLMISVTRMIVINFDITKLNLL
jgi:hypothetical protein